MRLAVAALALLLSSTALAREVAGVSVPDTAAIGPLTLKLNGAGLRYKMFIKVYVGALYLENKASDVNAILAADVPWLVTMTFKRGVEKEKIIGAFKEGFENNSRKDLASLLPVLAIVESKLSDFKEGDVFTISYAPTSGAVLTPPPRACRWVVWLISRTERYRAPKRHWLSQC